MLTRAASATLVALRPGSLSRDSIAARTFSSATDRAEEMHGLNAPLAFSRDTAIKSRIWFLATSSAAGVILPATPGNIARKDDVQRCPAADGFRAIAIISRVLPTRAASARLGTFTTSNFDP